GAGNLCLITPRCRLRKALGEALAAFIDALDRYTVADLVLDPGAFSFTPSPLPLDPLREKSA
ncbi:MAG: hypothetical protein ACM3YM_11795, partial [Sphingomonadales bacterium]